MNDDLVFIGYWCWRCENVNYKACRSDGVPLYASKTETDLGGDLAEWIKEERWG